MFLACIDLSHESRLLFGFIYVWPVDAILPKVKSSLILLTSVLHVHVSQWIITLVDLKLFLRNICIKITIIIFFFFLQLILFCNPLYNGIIAHYNCIYILFYSSLFRSRILPYKFRNYFYRCNTCIAESLIRWLGK